MGGRPSDLGLKEGLKDYLPLDTAKRINEKISSVLPSSSQPHSAFLYAMQQASSADNPRVDRFNTLYAYHRGLLVLVVLGDLTFAAAMFWGSFSGWTSFQKAIGICLSLPLVLLVWYRAWQRACYYVREVLLTAERVLDGRKKATPQPETAHFGKMGFEPVEAGTDKLSILRKRKDDARRI